MAKLTATEAARESGPIWKAQRLRKDSITSIVEVAVAEEDADLTGFGMEEWVGRAGRDRRCTWIACPVGRAFLWSSQCKVGAREEDEGFHDGLTVWLVRGVRLNNKMCWVVKSVDVGDVYVAEKKMIAEGRRREGDQLQCFDRCNASAAWDCRSASAKRRQAGTAGRTRHEQQRSCKSGEAGTMQTQKRHMMRTTGTPCITCVTLYINCSIDSIAHVVGQKKIGQWVGRCTSVRLRTLSIEERDPIRKVLEAL